MWFILVGEPRVDTFWKKFSFHPLFNVRVSSMSARPCVAVCMDEDRDE